MQAVYVKNTAEKQEELPLDHPAGKKERQSGEIAVQLVGQQGLEPGTP